MEKESEEERTFRSLKRTEKELGVGEQPVQSISGYNLKLYRNAVPSV